MKPATHIQRMRAQYNYNRMQVLWLTGMSESQLMQFMFGTGIDWLLQYGKLSEDEACKELRQPEIWAWWLNEWNRRDQLNLPCLYDSYEFDKLEIVARYRILHQEAFIKWTPPYNFLARGFEQVVRREQKTIAEQLKKR